jgi:moderate conductance mechanosensitive channel
MLVLTRKALAQRRKIRSIIGLIASVGIFVMYFTAAGYALREVGVSLTAYFASATVIGLAVGFGSQGVVQDVVTGLTLVFSDLIDVDDMVEIGGQTGVVRSIGMRFLELENAMGAKVFMPNRIVGSVINYPRGYVRCLVDVALPADPEKRVAMEKVVERLMGDYAEQYPGIMQAPPSVEGIQTTTSGKVFMHVKFRIWPGRGQPLETLFRQELVKTLQGIDATYADWMVSVLYETERPFVRRG